MAKLSPLDFIAKWQARFAPNTTFKIEEADFQEFATDVADSFGVSVVNVPEYVPGTPYTAGYLVRYTPAGGQESFYYALKAGLLAAPGGNFTEWKVVPGPVKETDLAQAITLVQAQGLDQTSVKAGRLYLIDFGVDGQGATQTIAVRGVSNDCFDTEGTLEVGGLRWAVEAIDVQAGTFIISYTQPVLTQLLATKQPALTTYLRTSLYGYATWAMPASYLNQAVALASLSDVEITLPTLTLADIPGTLWLLNNNNPSSNSYKIKILGQHAGASGYVSELVTLKPGESVRLDTARLPQFPPPVGVPDKPVYVVTSYTSLAPASVTPAQLAAVATSLPLRPARSADDVLTPDDLGALVPVTGTAPVTLTVPAGLGLATPYGVAKVCYPVQLGSGPLTIAGGAGVNLMAAPGGGLRTAGTGSRLVLLWVDANTILVEGGIV